MPLDTLRERAQAESERSSVGDVAARISVGRTTLHNFVNGITRPHPRIRRLLALWHLRETGGEHADAEAGEALLMFIPDEQRGAAVAELQHVIRALHRRYDRGAEEGHHGVA